MDEIITKCSDDITVSKYEMGELCFDYFIEGMEASDRDVLAVAKEISDFVVAMAEGIRRNQVKRRNEKNMLFTKFIETFEQRNEKVFSNAKKIIMPR